MKARGYGRIVYVSSTTGPLVAMPLQSTYATAKAAMVGLTRALALEVAQAGITVNAVGPGWIATASATAAEAEAALASPMRRAGTPDEVAAAHRLLGLTGGLVRDRAAGDRRRGQLHHRGQGPFLNSDPERPQFGHHQYPSP